VAEAAFQRRARAALMEAGVNLVAPETVHLAFDTQVAGGAVIERSWSSRPASRSRPAR